MSGSTDRSECIRLAGAFLAERRGYDIGGRARQDLDNARRVLAEEWPEAESVGGSAVRSV